MKIYLDIIFIINLLFDFLLLLTVSIILRRKLKISRLLIGSLLGGLSIFLLFIKISSLELFIFKIVISILMILITFGRVGFIKNITYLYFTSIVLGGFIYFLNNQLSYKVEGLVFINNGYSINIILLLFISPIIMYFFIKQNQDMKRNISNYHSVIIIYKKVEYKYNAFLDTGNKLKDPYKLRPVSILFDNSINIDKYLIIPYNGLDKTGIMNAFVADKMIIDNKYVIEKPVIALSKDKFNLDESEIILNSSYGDIFLK